MSIAEINDKTLTIVGPGVCTVEAYQDGNENYLPADPVGNTLIVNLVLGLPNRIEEKQLKFYPNPSSGNFNIIPFDGISEKINITVYNSTGNKVICTTDTIGSTFSLGSNSEPGLYIIHLLDLQSSKEFVGKLLIR